MTQPCHRTTICAVSIIASSLLMTGSYARADDPSLPAIRLGSPPPGVTQCRGSVYNLVVYRDGGLYEIPLNGTTVTSVRVHSGLLNAPAPTAETDGFEIVQVGNLINAFAKSGTPTGALTTTKLISPLFQATLLFRASHDGREAPDLVNVWHISEVEAYQLEVAEAAEALAVDKAQEMVMDRLRHPYEVLQQKPVHIERGRTRITIDGSGRLGDHAYFPFTIWNMGDPELDQTIQFSSIQVFDKNRQRNLATHVSPSPPSSAQSGIVAAVLPGGSLQGNIAVTDADRLVPPIEIVFTDASTGAPLVLEIERYKQPSMHIDDYNQMWRQRDRYSQTAVSVRLFGGGMWLGDRANQQLLAGTGMSGLAVRVQKGYGWGGAIEGELMGGRTGHASFEQVDWNGTRGNINRQASFGRAFAYFAMRFGFKWIFTGRAGLGMQGVHYDSTFETGNTTNTGPGDGFEINGLWSLGASLDARFGKNWIIGAATAFATPFNDVSPSFEGGIHIGYGWGEE